MIHSDNQTTLNFHKTAKVFKTSTQRMRLMMIDPTVVEDKLANQCELEIYNEQSQSWYRSLEESLPTIQGTTQEGVGESFSQLHRNDDCPDRHRSH